MEDAKAVQVVSLVKIERCVVGKKKKKWMGVEDWFVQPESQWGVGTRYARDPSTPTHVRFY